MSNLLLLSSPASKPQKEHGPIRVAGRDFVDENGAPWPFKGYTVHYLLNALYGVGAAASSDFNGTLDEAVAVGANTIISIGLHASPWKTEHGWRLTPLEHPDYFDRLGEMFDRCADRGLRVAHGVFADLQHMPAGFDAQGFWRQSCDVMRGRWNVIARKGNESKHNGWYEGDFLYPGENGNRPAGQTCDMGGVLCSQGSKGGEENPATPYLDFCEYELRRDLPKMFVDAPLRQLNDGDFEGSPGQGKGPNRPIVSIEPIYFNDTNPDAVGDERSTDPRVALELGIMTGVCAGGGFGASASLECKRLGPVARQCAEQYFRGLSAAFLRPLAALDFQGQQ